jgi:hypothetical protein
MQVVGSGIAIAMEKESGATNKGKLPCFKPVVKSHPWRTRFSVAKTIGRYVLNLNGHTFLQLGAFLSSQTFSASKHTCSSSSTLSAAVE